MRLTDFNTNENCTFLDIHCISLDKHKKIRAIEGRIRAKNRKQFSFIGNSDIFPFYIDDRIKSSNIFDRLHYSAYNLAYIRPLGNKGEFNLHLVFFFRVSRETKLNIYISDDLKSILKTNNLIADLVDYEKYILDNFVLSDGVEKYYAYNYGENRREIKLYGRDYSFLILLADEDINEQKESFLELKEIDIKNDNIPELALKIGDLEFTDEKKYVSEKLKQEIDAESHYLKIWNEYAAKEGDFLLEKARKVGSFRINKNQINYSNDGTIIYPIGLSDEAMDIITENDSLMFSEEIPIYIKDESLDWRKYAEYKEEQRILNKQFNIPSKEEQSRTYEILKIDKKTGTFIIKTENTEIPYENVSLSIYGNIKQIERREKARNLIKNAQSANPALGLLIEGVKPNENIIKQTITYNNPLTIFVRNKIFKNEPTETQKKAIEIALNTPDIAIIQGPPGTGKTTVITAIIERLNELSDKSKDNRGEILVTSFQHDAVKNVIERLRINSLPTIKFGARREDEDNSINEVVENWCKEYSEKLKERNPIIQKTKEEKVLSKKIEAYISSPSNFNANSFLECVRRICSDKEILDKVDQIEKEINFRENIYENKLINKIYRLRTTKEGFLDDGISVINDLLYEFEYIFNGNIEKNNKVNKIYDILEQAENFKDKEPTDEFLKEIQDFKRKLLLLCIPRPTYRPEVKRQDIIEIYNNVSQQLRSVNPKNDKDEILYNLLNELEFNIEAVEDTIKNYAFVYSATTQQSEGRDIRKVKGAKNKDDDIVYDTVIIDEAARVNPGDLMIPMAQAKRRIILVGDHRQLPHIYDEEIFESMNVDGEDINEDIIKNSMFQYLIDQMRKLAKQDGIQRNITLDAQYRMHPLLGNFVSENFYESYGESFKSPLPAEKFNQDLYDVPLVWVDMPYNKGREEKRGTSRIRECEADYIVEKLKKFIENDKEKKLTYGVITFYSSQVNLIKRKLGELSKFVRVGSVDAFQGMEFDVIFLSVVRSYDRVPERFKHMDKNRRKDEDYETYCERIGLPIYGFLTSKNRLCVALSRQKRLLIVVGDKTIFYDEEWKDIADICVPAMRNLYDLCEREGKIING